MSASTATTADPIPVAWPKTISTTASIMSTTLPAAADDYRLPAPVLAHLCRTLHALSQLRTLSTLLRCSHRLYDLSAPYLYLDLTLSKDNYAEIFQGLILPPVPAEGPFGRGKIRRRVEVVEVEVEPARTGPAGARSRSGKRPAKSAKAEKPRLVKRKQVTVDRWPEASADSDSDVVNEWKDENGGMSDDEDDMEYGDDDDDDDGSGWEEVAGEEDEAEGEEMDDDDEGDNDLELPLDGQVGPSPSAWDKANNATPKTSRPAGTSSALDLGGAGNTPTAPSAPAPSLANTSYPYPTEASDKRKRLLLAHVRRLTIRSVPPTRWCLRFVRVALHLRGTPPDIEAQATVFKGATHLTLSAEAVWYLAEWSNRHHQRSHPFTRTLLDVVKPSHLCLTHMRVTESIKDSWIDKRVARSEIPSRDRLEDVRRRWWSFVHFYHQLALANLVQMWPLTSLRVHGVADAYVPPPATGDVTVSYTTCVCGEAGTYDCRRSGPCMQHVNRRARVADITAMMGGEGSRLRRGEGGEGVSEGSWRLVEVGRTSWEGKAVEAAEAASAAAAAAAANARANPSATESGAEGGNGAGSAGDRERGSGAVTAVELRRRTHADLIRNGWEEEKSVGKEVKERVVFVRTLEEVEACVCCGQR